VLTIVVVPEELVVVKGSKVDVPEDDVVVRLEVPEEVVVVLVIVVVPEVVVD